MVSTRWSGGAGRLFLPEILTRAGSSRLLDDSAGANTGPGPRTTSCETAAVPAPQPPTAVPLSIYGSWTEVSPLDWEWVDAQLDAAGIYWVVADGAGPPHPRPLWGLWIDHRLHLSIGSPVINRQLAGQPSVTAHLESGTDVVILEGSVAGSTEDPRLLERYDAKYDWNYTVDEYGPLTTVVPKNVLAWRSAGWAGRESFRTAGKWRFG
jgi:hypothetical protein